MTDDQEMLLENIQIVIRKQNRVDDQEVIEVLSCLIKHHSPEETKND